MAVQIVLVLVLDFCGGNLAEAKRSGDGAFGRCDLFVCTPCYSKRCRAPLAAAVQNRHSTFHACRQDSMATCAGTSSQRSRNLLRYSKHLSASAPLPGQNTTDCAASGITQSRHGFRLAVGSLGGLFEPLPLRRPLSGGSGHGRKPVPNTWLVARKDGQVGQQARRHSNPQSLAQLPGNADHLREVISGKAQLHAPKSGETRSGIGGEPISMVFGPLV